MKGGSHRQKEKLPQRIIIIMIAKIIQKVWLNNYVCMFVARSIKVKNSLK